MSETGRHINGTLGLLIRQHYPGMVTYASVTSPPWTWDHFYAAEEDEERPPPRPSEDEGAVDCHPVGGRGRLGSGPAHRRGWHFL